MPVDPKYNIITRQRANRRGFLLGITLAELMLVTLFVLLLLLGNFQRIEDRAGGAESLVEASAIGESITQASPRRTLSDTWRVLKRKIQELASEDGQLDRWLDQMESDPVPEMPRGQDETEALRHEIGDLRERLAGAEGEAGDLQEQVDERDGRIDELKAETEQLQEDLDDTKNRARRLGEELSNAKEGGLVLCMFEPPGPDSSLPRGRSIPLGTVHLEDDGITLLQKEALGAIRVVDYVGQAYDTADAQKLLDGWQLRRKLSFDEFAALGAEFVALGDRESDVRQSCRFSMNYYLEDYATSLSVLTERFQGYFFPQRQSAISRAEFEELVVAPVD